MNKLILIRILLVTILSLGFSYANAQPEVDILAEKKDKKNTLICDEKQICMKIQRVSKELQILNLVNEKPNLVSVIIDIKSDNLKFDEIFPVVTTIAGFSKRKITNIEIKSIYKKADIEISFKWVNGDVFSSHMDADQYYFPYMTGKRYIVGQGFNEKITHNKNMQYSIDWNMAIGTKVYAARSGMVVELNTENKDNILGITQSMDKSNYIKIQHLDGTIATYGHLKKDGAAVKVNDIVKRKDLIGYSGNSGYTTGPHLHFHVAEPVIEKEDFVEKTIPFKFRNCEVQNAIIPKKGASYKAC
jgi:murein DD-endopeptidase MepM/ murein hydrolase activator NlpD